MDHLVGFLLHPSFSEIGKKIGKMLKYTPHFQSAFGTAVSDTEIKIILYQKDEKIWGK